MINETENRPVLYPLKRLLYSRKIMLAVIALVITLMGELGLPEDIVDNVQEIFIWIIGSWTVKDVSSNLVNGKNNG